LRPVLHVEAPGLFTTVQDLGRLSAISAGVPQGGAMDRFAHSAANLLVGNHPGRATLECTLRGPALVADDSCLVAITGADFDAHVNGAPVPMWTSTVLGAGDRLSFASRRSGARAYIAVAGGIEADRWLGSQSTYVLAARGGMSGRPLKAGDVLMVSAEAGKPAVPGCRLDANLRPDYDEHTLYSIAGPHAKRLSAEGLGLLFGTAYTLSPASDRMGYRLEGAPLVTTGEELLSFGLVAGAVQVPHNGQPILLMADHQTAGGYPVVATVVSASIPIAAQLLPGDELRFREIGVERAHQMRKALESALDSLR